MLLGLRARVWQHVQQSKRLPEDEYLQTTAVMCLQLALDVCK